MSPVSLLCKQCPIIAFVKSHCLESIVSRSVVTSFLLPTRGWHSFEKTTCLTSSCHHNHPTSTEFLRVPCLTSQQRNPVLPTYDTPYLLSSSGTKSFTNNHLINSGTSATAIINNAFSAILPQGIGRHPLLDLGQRPHENVPTCTIRRIESRQLSSNRRWKRLPLQATHRSL
jgi:hypothetical protein